MIEKYRNFVRLKIKDIIMGKEISHEVILTLITTVKTIHDYNTKCKKMRPLYIIIS